MTGKKQIVFKDGCFGGLRFTEISSNEFSAAEFLASGLDRLKFSNPDLKLFFARSDKVDGSNDLFWEINEPDGHKTLEFHELDDLPEQRAEIERRNIKFEADLRKFHKKIKPITTEDKKILEALHSILANFSERMLYAGFDEQKKEYFPVVIGWGGKFVPDTSGSGELIGRSAVKVGINPPAPGPTGVTEKNTFSGRTAKPFHRLYWLIWLIIFVLSILIIAKLIPSCGLRGVANTCEAVSVLDNDINSLENYRQKLQRQSLVQHNICLQTNKRASSVLDPDPVEGNLEIKSRLDREEVISSEVSVSLVWNTREDLDLTVVCPNNKQVSYKKKLMAQNNCGDLDVDANYNYPMSTKPIEHIDLKPLSGTYKIIVNSVKNSYSNTTRTPTTFKVEVNNFGEATLFDGGILPDEERTFFFDGQP